MVLSSRGHCYVQAVIMRRDSDYVYATPACGALATFNASYPGSNAVGTVTLQIPRCLIYGVALDWWNYFQGTFTVTTNVGTLSGTVMGSIYVAVSGYNAYPTVGTLTLTASTATGLFTGTTGSLKVNLQWPEPPSIDPVSGSVTPA
jgi:hypothetical protein